MEEQQLKALEAEFAKAATDAERAAAARKAGAVLDAVESDLFSSADEVKAGLTAACAPAFLAAITASTPGMARAAVLGRLNKDVPDKVPLDGGGEAVDKLAANAGAVLKDPALRAAFAACLAEEAMASGDGRCADGAAFERRSCLGPLLALGPVPPFAAFAAPPGRPADPLSPSNPHAKHPALRYFRSLPSFPRHSRDAFEKQAFLIRDRHRKARGAATELFQKVAAGKATKEGVRAWAARAVAHAAPLSETRPLRERCWHPAGAASPDFGLGVAAMTLRLAAPLWERGLGAKVDWTYVLRDERVQFSGEMALLMAEDEDDAAEEDEEEGDAEARRMLKLALEESLKPLHPGFFPADGHPEFSFVTEIFFLAHKAVSAYLLPLWSEFEHQQRFLLDLRGRLDEETLEARLRLHGEGWACALEDPKLLEDAGAFASFSVAWLQAQLKAPDARTRATKLPAALIRDACQLWSHLARASDARDRSGQRAAWSERQASEAVLACCALMREPLVESPLVHAKIVDFLCELLRPSGPARGRRGQETSMFFGANRGLAGAVMDSEQIRRSLPAALLHLYCEVSAVVGLDVDADDHFDKFTIRKRLNTLISLLWRHPLADSKQAILAFLSNKQDAARLALAALDTVVYCGEDALDRLADGKRREVDGKAPAEGSRARAFYDSQKRTCSGFLPIAESTLRLLGELGVEDAARNALLGDDRALARGAAVGVALCAAAGTEGGRTSYGVSEPQQWRFDAPRLLDGAATLLELLRRARGDGALAKAVARDGGEGALLKEASEAPGGGGLCNVVKAVAGFAGLEAVADARPKVDAALANGSDVDAAAYAEALGDLTLDTVEDLAEDHCFASKPAHANAKPLQKELRKLRRDLPEPHPDGALFVRFDETRLDLCRCAITGPADTPYHGGLFVFDVWFPPTYPRVPPLVQLVTTGSGTVRFNPNLYADGKVCLSLLGTWHAGDASEKWSADTGSLRQVLLSIQHQILVGEPYFNEPGRDASRGTKEGAEASKLKNAELRKATLQHAFVAHLKRPPRGLEDVAAEHLARAGAALLARAKPDLESGPTGARGLHAAAAALADHVSSAPRPAKRAKTDSESSS